MDRSARAEPNTSRRARSGVPSRPPSVGAARPPPSSSASKVSERHPPSSTRVPSDDAPKTRASRVPSSASRAPASSGDPASASASASVTITPDALREACGGADPRVALACDLRNRRLASVPAPIASLLDAVATLDVSHNAIETLEGLAPMRRLRALNASDNRVRSLAGAAWPPLETLRVSDNALETLEGVQPLARSLTHLRVDGNALGSASRLVGRLTQLTRLDVSRCGLTKLEGFATLHHLESLACAGNAIASLEPLAKCASLAELDVADNRIDADALAHLAPLKNLDALALDGNSIATLEKMPRLENLTDLSAARCRRFKPPESPADDADGAAKENAPSSRRSERRGGEKNDARATRGPSPLPPPPPLFAGAALVAALPSIETLDLSECDVDASELERVCAALGSECESLAELRLAPNPCVPSALEDELGTLEYRRAVLRAFPTLTYLDDVAVSDADLDEGLDPAEAIRARDVTRRLGAAGVDVDAGRVARAAREGRPATPAGFGFLGVAPGASAAAPGEDEYYSGSEGDDSESDDDAHEGGDDASGPTEGRKKTRRSPTGTGNLRPRFGRRPEPEPEPETTCFDVAVKFEEDAKAAKAALAASIARVRAALAADPRDAREKGVGGGGDGAGLDRLDRGGIVARAGIPAAPVMASVRGGGGIGGVFGGATGTLAATEARLAAERDAARRARARHRDAEGREASRIVSKIEGVPGDGERAQKTPGEAAERGLSERANGRGLGGARRSDEGEGNARAPPRDEAVADLAAAAMASARAALERYAASFPAIRTPDRNANGGDAASPMESGLGAASVPDVARRVERLDLDAERRDANGGDEGDEDEKKVSPVSVSVGAPRPSSRSVARPKGPRAGPKATFGSRRGSEVGGEGRRDG